MPNDGFCKPCQAMLCGEREMLEEFPSKLLSVHHPDAQSFRQALDLQCPLCVRLWTAMKKPTKLHDTIYFEPFTMPYLFGPDVYRMSFMTNASRFDSLNSDDVYDYNDFGRVHLTLIDLCGKRLSLGESMYV
jgi:hypothetical protein